MRINTLEEMQDAIKLLNTAVDGMRVTLYRDQSLLSSKVTARLEISVSGTFAHLAWFVKQLCSWFL